MFSCALFRGQMKPEFMKMNPEIFVIFHRNMTVFPGIWEKDNPLFFQRVETVDFHSSEILRTLRHQSTSMGLFQSSKRVKKDKNPEIAPKIQAFNWPSFAEGENGTLHGQINRVDGYDFMHVVLKGDLKIKTPKGCHIVFQTKEGEVNCKSDSRDIESFYSDALQQGLTQFDFLLDKPLKNQLKKGVSSIRLTFKKNTYSFDISDPNRFRFLMK